MRNKTVFKAYEEQYELENILTPTFLIRSPIIFIANILVHGASAGFTLLLLLLLFPVTPPTTLFPTNRKQEKTEITTDL